MGQVLSDCQQDKPQIYSTLKESNSIICLKNNTSADNIEQSHYSNNLEEKIFMDEENMIGINQVSINELQEAIRPISTKGVASKVDVLKALGTIRNLKDNEKLQKFLSAYEKKKLTSPGKSPQETKYIPLHKLLAGLYFMSRDSRLVKLEAIYTLYQQSQQELLRAGALSMQRLKDLIDHLYFLVIYAIPSLIDSENIHYDQIQALKLEMQKRAQSDKINLLRMFNQYGGLYLNKEDFLQMFSIVRSIQSTSGIRTRIMPVLGQVVSRVYFKDEMIKRCYGSKHSQENSPKRKKQVRFKQLEDENKLNLSTSFEEKLDSKKKLRPKSPLQLFPRIQHQFQEDQSHQQEQQQQQRSNNQSPSVYIPQMVSIDDIDSDSLRLPVANIYRSVDDLAEQSTLSEEKILLNSKSLPQSQNKFDSSNEKIARMNRVYLFEVDGKENFRLTTPNKKTMCEIMI